MSKMTKADIQKRQAEILNKLDEMDEKTNVREARMRTLTSEEQKGTITEEQKRELEALKAEQRSQDIEYDGLVRESAGLSTRAKAMATGKELEQLIRKASVSIYPSEWYENCPFSVMESQMYGTPVLGARIGGIPELIQEGNTGELFESGNAAELLVHIRDMWDDRKKLENYSENCKAARFLTVEQYCAQLEHYYRGE